MPSMAVFQGKRRVLLLPALLFLFIFTLLAIDESLKPGRFSRIITGKPTTSPESTSPASTSPESTSKSPSHSRASSFHYLVPASSPNIKLCYNIISAAVNRYPAALLLGWKGQGEMDAAETHLAKLRAIQQYLQNLSTDDDDDLVLIVDGYDIILQLPVEIMIERYFTIQRDSDARLAQRFNMSVDALHDKGFRNTIFWGPDKICWPIDWSAPRCWAVPDSHLDAHTFGPNQGDGGMATNDPKWLNSGTVIGPVGDLRTYINVTMAEIARTYDANFYNSESDQYYLANVWGRQEYHRSKEVLALRSDLDDKAAAQLEGSDDYKLPDPLAFPGEPTEFHISIEYESQLFQTKAGYERYFGPMKFDQPGYTARMDVDMFEQGTSFVPYSISMPAAVYAALTRVYEAAVKPSSSAARGFVSAAGGEEEEEEEEEEEATSPHQNRRDEAATATSSRSRLPASEWLRSASLGVNYVTRHIYGLWHCTGDKDYIDGEYKAMWFFPYAASLLRANALASRAGDELTAAEMDGRAWLPRLQYPREDSRNPMAGGEYGGVFTDYEGEKFLSFGQLCGEWQDTLFSGEMPPPPPPPTEEAAPAEATAKA